MPKIGEKNHCANKYLRSALKICKYTTTLHPAGSKVAYCAEPLVPLTYYVKKHFRYLGGGAVEIHSALVAPDVGGEHVV